MFVKMHQLLLLIILLHLVVSVTAKCTEEHMDTFFACVKAMDKEFSPQVEIEYIKLIERRNAACFDGEGQCKLKGEWETADDLCIGAKVCDCTFCDIFFHVVAAVQKDLAAHIKAGVCLKRRLLDDMFILAGSCVKDEVGMDMHSIMSEHMVEDHGNDKNGRQTGLYRYMLSRTHIDRCWHFKEARSRARKSDECWWQQADEKPIGLVTCGIAKQCLRQAANDDSCTQLELRKSLNSVCTCLKGARRSTAALISDISDKAVRSIKKRGSQQQKAKRCIDIAGTVSNASAVNFQASIDHTMTVCSPAESPPFSAADMTTAMCQSAAKSGRTWNLRHGLAQATNFFTMYAAEKTIRYCACL